MTWLLTVLEDERIDMLLVAGDVFDGPNPTAQSQQLFYNFLAAAKTRLPTLEVVILGGNHDSAARLDAKHPVLAAFGVHMVGGLPRKHDGSPDLDRCLIELRRPDGSPAAYLAAVPYLPPGTLCLPLGLGNADQKLAQSMGSFYRALCEEASRRAGCTYPSIVTGHLFVTGCQVAEASERKIQNGYLASLPPEAFSPRPEYIALGHLHLGQTVADNIHYCGSPLPLAFDESDYCQRVLIAEFSGPRLVEVRPLPVPRPVDWLRIPGDQPQPPEKVLEDLRKLDKLKGRDPASPARPYLEIRIRLDRPRPTLREETNRELHDKWPRLLKITLDNGQRTTPSHRSSTCRSLDELSPEEVFRHCYRLRYASAETILNEPGDQIMQAFRFLWEEHERQQAQ